MALMADGSRVKSTEITSWYEKTKEPKFDSKQPLFKENHARWLIDTTSQDVLRLPEEYVEFFGGDRLPAKVMSFRFGNEDSAWTLPRI